MTDREAILSTINTQFNHCADVYEDYEKRMKSIKKYGIYACTFCEFNKGYEKSSKETTREIILEIKDSMKCYEDDDDGYILKKCEFECFIREIAKQHGVEVE